MLDNEFEQQAEEYQDCHIYNKGWCDCYQMKCTAVKDCARKLLEKRALEQVKNILR